MDLYPAVWNVLHDGSVVGVQGTVPGTVRLDISIDYLRDRFPDPGKTIQVTLTNCSWFAYRDFESQALHTDLGEIAALQPEVLSAEMRGDLAEISCVKGNLEVRAIGGSLMLDSGRSITLKELLDVSEAYWIEWSARAEQARRHQPPP